MTAITLSCSYPCVQSIFFKDDTNSIGAEIFGALKLTLSSHMDERVPIISEIAATTGISIRSLQRKLSAAGLTYSQLVEAARYERAIELLRTSDVKIIEVAFASGYSDPAHFTRAFRRMSGTTPRRFRNEAIAG